MTDHSLAPRILYVQYTNPAAYPPLEHSSRILANQGWEVLFLGTRDVRQDPRQFPPHPQVQVETLPFCPAGWRQKLHYLQFCFQVLWRVLRWRPQWLYVSDPLACPIAVGLGSLHSIRLLYHEHDEPPLERSTLFFRWVLWARRRMAEIAQICILPNEERAKRFSAAMKISDKVFCIWNCPSSEEAAPTPERGQGNRFLYQGSLVPSRLPLTLLAALKMLPESVRLQIVGYETIGHRGYLERLKEEARRQGVEGRVEFIGTVPTRKDLLESCRRCDVGLTWMPMESPDRNDHTMTGASNKPFDYLACGLALLVSDLPDWKKVFVDPGFGLACNPENPKEIAQVLRWFLEHPQQTREMGERGRRKILEEWNYEKQFAPLLPILEKEGRI